MKEAMDMNVLSELEKRAVVAVLEIESAENAVPTAKALAAGGVTAIELALRTDAAEPSIALIKKEVPEMMIGIGTIILSGQAKRVKKAGASFGVAPGLNANIVKEAIIGKNKANRWAASDLTIPTRSTAFAIMIKTLGNNTPSAIKIKLGAVPNLGKP